MAHQHLGHWQATPGPREAPATLRPPKRHGEDAATPGASPKRSCPSPSPSPDPSWLHPGPRSGSGSEVCTDTASPFPPSFNPAFQIEYLDENVDARSDLVSPHSAQDELGAMDWVSTHAAPVHEVITDSDLIICYGALCDAKARFSPPDEAKRRFCLLSVTRSGLYYVLSTRSNKVVARLDLSTCRALRSLDGLVAVKAVGVIESAAVFRNQEKGGIVPLSINVYGPMSSADQVGRVLSKASAFLQHPFFLEPSCKGYFNPQLFRTGNELEDLTHLVGLTEKDIRAKAISDEVQHILESLDDVAPSGHLDSEARWQPQDWLLTCLTEFHGKNRPTSVSDLKGFDIVLTTYATLSAEHKKQGVLHQVDWYRVVLDEGKAESHVRDNG
ncbi:hypothetical protein NEMBOFW57_010545 [Staphylotrichum longicolle]|uniref:Uncharacterized protein n=1 Tax=Staphylotrichum longicolle TaxID=669026 RepID=A0AAD4ERP4_9PEZI|nr:hypothetical protein NEMBOFW57_010545 [Staphylotrichum longicolle]